MDVSRRRISRSLFRLGATVLLVASIGAAWGCSGSKSTATSAPSATAASTDAAASGTPGRGRGNRTPSPDMLTSIAEGTPRAFGGGRNPAFATAIAQGTPASALRPNFGGGQLLAPLAMLLKISEGQLRTELQATSASFDSVAAAHGVDRNTLKLGLIAAYRQRQSDAVTGGQITQAAADQMLSQFEANLDSVIDATGGGGRLGQPTPGP